MFKKKHTFKISSGIPISKKHPPPVLPYPNRKLLKQKNHSDIPISILIFKILTKIISSFCHNQSKKMREKKKQINIFVFIF